MGVVFQVCLIHRDSENVPHFDSWMLCLINSKCGTYLVIHSSVIPLEVSNIFQANCEPNFFY